MNAAETSPVPEFRRVDRGWVRSEPGYLTRGDPAYVHTTGRDDLSPAHLTYPTGYDSRCGWCYLGAPHTEAAHTRLMTP